MFVVDDAVIARLDQISRIRRHYMDQLDAMAAECCTLLGVDPDQDSKAADFARSIVDSGEDVDFAVSRVAIELACKREALQ